ncbi:MAG TPA: recombination protein RecR [Phycisphaerales bacterium]|nr:recombination protein RecR [Phycisphaerales bacterium]
MCLPSIGPKTANRLAYYLLDAPSNQVDEMIASLDGIRTEITRCSACGNYAEAELCPICSSLRRDTTTLCVVGYAKDVIAFERTGEYRGLYHVLGGLISPMEGRGPESLSVDALLERVQQGDFKEVVLATDPTVAGEATALYLEQLLDEFEGEVSRLALGIPLGSDFEYTDEITLGRALSYRQRMSKGK